MPDKPSITLVKRFTYRGLPEEWSNTYHFSGTTPANEAAWRTLALGIFDQEKTCYTASSVLVTAYGYEAGNEHSVSQMDFTTGTPLLPPGTLALSSGVREVSGDQAGWIRAKIGVSSTGKKVYIRKYLHGGEVTVGAGDNIAPGCRTAYDAFAAKLLDGTLSGDFRWCGPQGQVATLPFSSVYVTTRTLKRRGKRP